MEPYTFFQDLMTEVPDIPAGGIVTRTFFKDDQIKALVFGFDSGQELSEHAAARPAILHFLQGEADVTLGDDSFIAAAGTWTHMPPNLPHSITAKTPVIMLLILL